MVRRIAGDNPLYRASEAFYAHYAQCGICHIDPPVICPEGRELLKGIAQHVEHLLMADWIIMNTRTLNRLTGQHFSLVTRKLQKEFVEAHHTREELEKRYGQVWSEEELNADFKLLGLFGPFVVVVRNQGGVRGTLEFQLTPRFYFNFLVDTEDTYKHFGGRDQNAE